MAEALARFDAVVATRPHAVALEHDDASWSFAELARASEHLAERLARAGTRPGDVVALSLGRSPEHVAAVLAVWRVGAAFLPLDPAAPPARSVAMLEECRARARLTLGAEGVELESLASSGEPLGAEGDALAYVLYTSGSTGRPKGVRVSHRALWPMLGQQIAAFGLGPGKRSLLYLSLAFDASISDLFTALLSGATLVVPRVPPTPQELPGLLAARAVTHANLPPSVLPLVNPAHLPACLEVVVIGGEVCPPKAVRAWARRARIVNVYGPTEATICTHLCTCDADTWERPLLGAPLEHVEQRVHEGELWLAGPALALGYVDRPELEASKFVVQDGKRWYRTGDRVRGADLEFVGRVDRQLKLRGQLVSPEEIEARLRDLAIADCVVAAVPDGLRDVLTAFVVTDTLTAEEVRARLADSLPRWMLPRVLVVRALPRGATGRSSSARFRRATSPRLASGIRGCAPSPRPSRTSSASPAWRARTTSSTSAGTRWPPSRSPPPRSSSARASSRARCSAREPLRPSRAPPPIRAAPSPSSRSLQGASRASSLPAIHRPKLGPIGSSPDRPDFSASGSSGSSSSARGRASTAWCAARATPRRGRAWASSPSTPASSSTPETWARGTSACPRRGGASSRAPSVTSSTRPRR